MSQLRTQFSEGLKEAMRAKDQRRVSTLRLILAALKDRDIAARTGERTEVVSDEDILQLLQKMVKQRNESIETYEQAGRIDLAELEREEKAIIESYLPKQLSQAEMEEAVRAVLAEIGAAGLKDMGRAMAELKARFTGRMDFMKASGIVKTVLSGG
ncbi:MAG: GatB/YqeY domain-containing protein [Alphaproteobacteria bacterium]|nr:GatB/YqeY domain-containing protein [Alphaproteobacteria bacterium]